MLAGIQSHVLDEKNRIRIPAKFKTELKGELVFYMPDTPCIYILPKSEFEKEAEKYYDIPLTDEGYQNDFAAFMSRCCDVEEDTQGRVKLPQFLIEHACIDKNVLTIGVGKRLEIWGEERRAEWLKDMPYGQRVRNLAERAVK